MGPCGVRTCMKLQTHTTWLNNREYEGRGTGVLDIKKTHCMNISSGQRCHMKHSTSALSPNYASGRHSQHWKHILVSTNGTTPTFCKGFPLLSTSWSSTVIDSYLLPSFEFYFQHEFWDFSLCTFMIFWKLSNVYETISQPVQQMGTQLWAVLIIFPGLGINRRLGSACFT
jgi:hypothetical protein